MLLELRRPLRLPRSLRDRGERGPTVASLSKAGCHLSSVPGIYKSPCRSAAGINARPPYPLVRAGNWVLQKLAVQRNPPKLPRFRPNLSQAQK